MIAYFKNNDFVQLMLLTENVHMSNSELVELYKLRIFTTFVYNFI